MRTLVSLALLLFAFTSARAEQLIVNGGFETGDLTGWSATGFTVQSAPVTPLTYNATAGPYSGSFYAVSDGYNPDTETLTQTFTTPASFYGINLSFAMFVNDVDGLYFGSDGPGGEVSLLNSTGGLIAVLNGPFDTFENNPGYPNSYVLYSDNIGSLLAPDTTYQLQFSNTDTTGVINVGVDNVSLVTTPEPGTSPLLATGGLLVFWLAYRKSKAVQA